MEERLKSIAVCGIYCGACPDRRGMIRQSAQSLRDLLEGWNIEDVAPFVLPPGMNYPAFGELLSAMASRQPCDGCRGGGNPICPIKLCAEKRGVVTCAECESFAGEIENPCGNEEARAIFSLISKRYSGWNLENLKKIKEVGLDAFMDEMDEKVSDGFITCDVISKEKIFSR